MDLDKAYAKMNIQTAPCCASCISWSPIYEVDNHEKGECAVLSDLVGKKALTKNNNMCDCFEGWDEI